MGATVLNDKLIASDYIAMMTKKFLHEGGEIEKVCSSKLQESSVRYEHGTRKGKFSWFAMK